MGRSQYPRSTDIGVFFSGPIAEPGRPAAGGFEAANRRTIDLLKRKGFNVLELPYSVAGARYSHGIAKVFRHSKRFRALEALLQNAPPGDLLHLTPLYKHFLLWEVPFLRRARKLNLRVLVDLRAGQADRYYDRFGSLYRLAFRHLLAQADVVAVEGERYIPFVKRLRPDVPVYYLPNFLPDADIPMTPSKRQPVPIRFAYVGSVNEAKGVLHSTRLIATLAEAGTAVQFDVLGKVDPAFSDQLKSAANGADWLVLHGPQPYDVIRSALSQAHFFMFLTKWRGEGHSNALTEAMSQGAVPVVTDHGFNRDVVGVDGIVVQDREQLAGAIKGIKALLDDPDELANRAERLVTRVRENYSETRVTNTLKQLYEVATNGRPGT